MSINESIITLEDLRLVDGKIEEVQRELEERNAQVQLKLNNIKNPFGDGQTTAVVGDIIEQLSKLSVGDVEESLAILDGLSEEHADLQLFQTLRQLYTRKQQANYARRYLEQAEEIESRISTVDTNSDYKAVHGEILLLDDAKVAQDTREEVVRTLKLQFASKAEATKQLLSGKLSGILEGINWLGNNFSTISPDDITAISSLVSSLIDLQAIYAFPSYPDTWWAIDVLLQPFVTRFDFHFNTKRETNRLSKPEWAFTFAEEFIAKNIKLFELVVDQAFKPYKIIMLHQIITSVLVPVRTKILGMMSILNSKVEDYKNTTNYDKSGRILSHLIFELTSFDQRLRNTYQYNPHLETIDRVPSKKWLGLTADILLQGDKERLGTSNWLNFESILANNRFKTEIIEDKQALSIDMDYKGSDELADEIEDANVRPTNSSLNLVKLFNNLTSHYQTMRMVKFQLKYVSTIQLKLIDNYHDFLKQALKRYDDVYYLLNVMNLIPGGIDSAKQDTNGPDSLKGLQDLTGIFCLAQFLLRHLEEWAEELIFIQLWNVYKSITQKHYDDEASIFDSAINQYAALIDNIRTRYKGFFQKTTKNFLKLYINTTQWEISESRDNAPMLAELLTTLPVYLGFLKERVLPSDYFIIANGIVSSICSLWYEFIITNNKFTKTGTIQLELDFKLIVGRLEKDLLISNLNTFSTHSNRDLVKARQAMELLGKYNGSLAKNLAKNFQELQVRGEFDHGLSQLRNEEVREILYRVL